jgi:hypothetical protein
MTVSGKQLLVFSRRAERAYEVYHVARAELLAQTKLSTDVAQPFLDELNRERRNLWSVMGAGGETPVLDFIEESLAVEGTPPFRFPGKPNLHRSACGAAVRLLFRLEGPVRLFCLGDYHAGQLRTILEATPAIDPAECKRRVIEEYGIAVRRLMELRKSRDEALVDSNGEAVLPAEGVTPGSLAELLGVSTTTIGRYATMARVPRPKPGQKGRPYPIQDVSSILQTMISKSPRDTHRAVGLLNQIQSSASRIRKV